MSVAANPPQSVHFQNLSLKRNLSDIAFISGLDGISGKLFQVTSFITGAFYGATLAVVDMATRPVFRKIAEYTDRTKTLVLPKLAVSSTATTLITSKVLEVSVAASAVTMLGLMATTFVVACGVRGTKDIVLAISSSIYAKCHA